MIYKVKRHTNNKDELIINVKDINFIDNINFNDSDELFFFAVLFNKFSLSIWRKTEIELIAIKDELFELMKKVAK